MRKKIDAGDPGILIRLNEICGCGFKLGLVLVGMSADEVDDFTAVIRGLFFVAACLVDHSQSIVAVVDFGEANEEMPCSLFRFVELPWWTMSTIALDAVESSGNLFWPTQAAIRSLVGILFRVTSLNTISTSSTDQPASA